MTKRIQELDALRGIAAMMVVLYHYTTRYDQLYEHSVSLPFSFSYGTFFVQLFFIISGFVIFLTLDQTKNSLDFVVSRISRLYPAYWTAIVITFLSVQAFGLPGREVSSLIIY